MFAKSEDRLYEGSVGQGLRVVAEMPSRGRVHLFAVEPERAGECEQLVQAGLGLDHTSGGGECLDQPERAWKEGAFAAGEAVLAGWVPVDQGSARVERVGDGVDRAAHAWGVTGFDPEQREHEEGRVEVGRAVRAGVAAECFVEAMGHDVRNDGVARGPTARTVGRGCDE